MSTYATFADFNRDIERARTAYEQLIVDGQWCAEVWAGVAP